MERRQVGDAVVVDFAAPSRLVAGSREYEEFLSSVGASSDTRVLIDLTRVTRVDSAGLGLLMRYYSRVLSNNGKFSVVKPSKDVEAVLEATGLARLLNISRDEVEALHASRRTEHPAIADLGDAAERQGVLQVHDGPGHLKAQRSSPAHSGAAEHGPIPDVGAGIPFLSSSRNLKTDHGPS